MRAARLALLLVALPLGGCQTLGPPATPARVPAVVEPLFTACAPADGAVSLQAFNAGQLLGSAEAAWLAKAGGDWDVEVTSAVGTTILAVSRRGSQIALTGPLAAKAPRLAITDAGYLEVDGHKVGIRADEVPCLFGSAFPRAWLRLVRDVDVAKEHAMLQLADSGRTIELDTKALGNPKDETSCATLSWRTILFFSQTLDWCRSGVGRRSGSLSGIEDYQLKWVRIDEH